ncbi:hypothetical protein PF005_g30845 [Phytophthora fragariae]|uniref:Uncharacterized protein n=2 Tax=Phytophthora fragariae TaxID=53985 RepID=A0A6A4A319_9STRA|nr:hypothetical protein PF005_g30845 [Phytophthora fragariae]KAE9247921.1 hypothetical protein PF002_g6028 [Phytophthora fragariae]
MASVSNALTGGQAGNTSKEAKAYACSPVYDLYRLFQKNKPAYQRKIRDAIKPFKIDQGGFSTITELLETTEALDPSLVEFDKRLSDRALTRIVKDLTSAYYVPGHWTPSTEVWRTLCNDKRIGALLVDITIEMREGEYELPTVSSYSPDELKPDYTPLMGTGGRPTALGPATRVDDTTTVYRPDPDDVLAAELAADEAKAAAAAPQQEVEEEEGFQNEGEVEVL